MLTVLDRYTNKYLKVWEISQSDLDICKAGDKIIYTSPDPKTGILKESIGTVIINKSFPWTTLPEHKNDTEEKTATLLRILEGEEKVDFEKQQEAALKIFPIFKKEFQAEFSNSIPITARFQIFSDQLYFFFYSEERYVFTEFVKKFREKIGKNMFLFQIGARDMMRMSPGANHMFCNGDIKLCCKTPIILPNIEIEAVVMQNLEGRDIEKLKGKCWKLKCCLLYELELYKEEIKKYPQKWGKIDLNTIESFRGITCENKEDCIGTVLSLNIMTQEVNIKTKEGIIRIPIEKLKGKKK